MTGERFGELIVLRRASTSSHGNKRYLCKCSCGAQTVARGSELRNGKKRQCRDAAAHTTIANRKA